MALNTVQALVTFALKAAGVLGVGQSALAEDYTDAFDACNSMLAVWNRRRYLVFHLLDVPLTSTGATSYTVGVGGDFNTPRPDRLEAAFCRQFVNSGPNYVDYPLDILESREDYNRIALKSLGSFPQFIFYDSAFPLGVVYPWPVPQAATYQIHLSLKAQITQFTSFVQEINLPPEYEEAIWSNLVIRLGPIYQYEVRPEIIALAKASLAAIRGANTQIPRLRMPRSLRNQFLYNVLSDSYY